MPNIREFTNRAIDLDKIIPNVVVIFKGVALIPGKNGQPQPAVWLSCDHVIVRTMDKDNKINEEKRVRDLIDCAFDTVTERDDFYNEILRDWKGVVGRDEQMPELMNNKDTIDYKVH